MSGRFYTTQFVIPANTAIAAPVSQAVILEDAQLDTLTIVIPDGHVGLTGIAITRGGVQTFPFIQGTWLTGNNDVVQYPYDGEITANGFVLSGYNTDIYPHSFYLRWEISDLTAASPVQITSPQAGAAPAPADIASIAALTSGGQ